MYNSISCFWLVLCMFCLSRISLPLPVAEQQIPQQPNDVSKIVSPESGALEENGNDQPVYIMVPVVGDRTRRGAVDGDIVNLENISYEVPPYIKFNESSKGDIEVSLIPNPDKHVQQQKSAPQPQVSGGFSFGGNGGSNNNYCPPLNGNNKSQPIAPICLTLSIDNIFPPGKRISVTNSSEIKGTGCVLRVKFAEAKDSERPTTCIPTDFLGVAKEKGLSQELDTEKKRKFDVEEEDDSATTQLIDQKALQELIFKILTSNKNGGSTPPAEEVVFLEKVTTEPAYSFLINPSILQRISRKHMTPAARRVTTLKRQASPDFDNLLKTVEHITSTMPKEKLLSLLSSLINKAALNKEMSSNQ